MSSPWVSFVVPAYNHLEQTQSMLKSLRASLPAELNYEVILVDDASSDGTRGWFRSFDDVRVKTILNPRNLGYAGSNNAGVRLARGALLGLLNNDLLFETGWLEPMLEALQSPGLNAGIVGNVQYRVSDGALDHAGVRLNAAGQFEHIQEFVQGEALNTKVSAVTGACMLLRKSDFEAVGGFDEQYVNGCEDIDLCFKVRAARKSIYVANRSRILHHVSLSRDVNSLSNVRNSRYLFTRWRPNIKQELSASWAALLQSGPAFYADKLHGELAAAFVATPQAAARVIAEATILREEYGWARDLGDVDPNEGLKSRCSALGLNKMPSLDGYSLGKRVEFAFENLRSARNFYVCGRALDDLSQTPISITIMVNGIQRQTFLLKSGHNVNVGIIHPILLAGITNRFKVEAHFLDAQDQRIGDARNGLVFTHIVVDNRIVSEF